MADQRVVNFSAGPATLPLPVLERAQRELVTFPGAGHSVMEMSHRSKYYTDIHFKVMQDLKELLNVPDNYDILFLQGGATTQFSMIPMNLMKENKTADYIVTGSWSKAAYKEAVQLGFEPRKIADTTSSNFTTLPGDMEFNPEASFVHYCMNETIYGVEFFEDLKGVPENVPVVVDVSSNILSRPMDISKFGLVYGGAQKNIGPAGVTIVIIRKDLIRDDLAGVPLMMQYKTHADPTKPSMYNTPPTYGIYMAGLVFEWLKEQGGLEWVTAHNIEKAKVLYDFIAESEGYYTCPVDEHCRSRMNVPFRVCQDADLEKIFVAECTKNRIINIKGHRSVGGCRASIYNAMPIESVQYLVDFMRRFMEEHPRSE